MTPPLSHTKNFVANRQSDHLPLPLNSDPFRPTSLYRTHLDRSLSHARSSYANLTVVVIVHNIIAILSARAVHTYPENVLWLPLPAVPSRAVPRDMTEN